MPRLTSASPKPLFPRCSQPCHYRHTQPAPGSEASRECTRARLFFAANPATPLVFRSVIVISNYYHSTDALNLLNIHLVAGNVALIHCGAFYSSAACKSHTSVSLFHYPHCQRRTATKPGWCQTGVLEVMSCVYFWHIRVTFSSIVWVLVVT